MISDIKTVRDKFNTTFAPLNRGTLTDEQAKELLDTGASVKVICQSVKKTFVWANKLANTPGRFCPGFIRILQSVRESSAYYMSQQHQKVGIAAWQQDVEHRVTKVREMFQSLVGDHHSEPFCLTTKEAEEILKRFQLKECIEAFNDLGEYIRMTPDLSQQDIVDRLEFYLEMSRV